MPQRAAIFVQRAGPSPQQQLQACLDHCAESHYTMLAIVPPSRPDDAVQLIREHRIDVVVAGYESKAVQQLAADIDDLGRVEVVHPEPKVIEPPRHKLGTLGDLVVKWFRRGRTIKEIAEEIDTDTTDIREILRKYGEHPPD